MPDERRQEGLGGSKKKSKTCWITSRNATANLKMVEKRNALLVDQIVEFYEQSHSFTWEVLQNCHPNFTSRFKQGEVCGGLFSNGVNILGCTTSKNAMVDE
jgi:hypothetical protein